MKKTFNINVAGFPFTINDDAYTLLSDYLETIEHTFRKMDESQELVTDIESRIAELLLERTSEGSPIVTVNDVEDVISRIGKPEEMIYDDETIIVTEAGGKAGMHESESSGERVTPPPFNPSIPPISKKLFRDTQDSMLGGVCSGLARFIDCDSTWVRLATVAIAIFLFFVGSISHVLNILWFIIPISYIILWIVVPEARTPIQRMQMAGENPTMENIGKTVTDTFKEDNGESVAEKSQGKSSFADMLAKIFGVIAKFFLFIGLIVGVPLLVAMIIGLLGCIFALIMFSSTEFFGNYIPWLHDYTGEIVIWGIICGIGSIFAIGSPLFFLVRKGLSKEKRQNSSALSWTVGILCLMGFLTAAIAVGKLVSINEIKESRLNFHKSSHYEYSTKWVGDWEEVNETELSSDSIVPTAATNDSVSSSTEKPETKE